MNLYIQAKEADPKRVLDFFQKEISAIRTGRVQPSILSKVSVEAYGVKNPINAVANVALADSQSLVISPWDKNIIKDIEKSLLAADLGLSIVNEGSQLRLKATPLTEESRKELVKKLNEKQEKARIDLRQVRDQIKSNIEKALTDKAIAEDDKFRYLKELDEIISKYNEELKDKCQAKEKEIMTI